MPPPVEETQDRNLTPLPVKEVGAKDALKGTCGCSFCKDTTEFLAKPKRPKYQIPSVIVGKDGKVRGMESPNWKMPIMVCVETCVFHLLGKEGDQWFQKVEVRPYQG